MLRFLLLVFLIQRVIANITIVCPSGYSNLYGRKCYKFAMETRNWTDSRANCQADGGDLLSIHSAEENTALKAALPSCCYYWIGLRCDLSNNPYWIDETTFGYNNMERGCSSDLQFTLSFHNDQWEYFLHDEGSYAVCTLEGYAATECGLDYELVEETDMCIKANKQVDTWANAEAACVGDGGHLASIHSKQVNTYLHHLAIARGFTNGVFIGMQLVDQTPIWTDGTAFDYSNLNEGMPNWMFGRCGALQTDELRGSWISVNCACSDHLPSFCVRSISCPAANTFEAQGEISSPQYPTSTVTGLQCKYYLAATPGQLVNIEFTELSLQPGDVVMIYEGLTADAPLAVVKDGHSETIHQTKYGSTMKLVHISGLSEGSRFWKVNFTSV